MSVFKRTILRYCTAPFLVIKLKRNWKTVIRISSTFYDLIYKNKPLGAACAAACKSCDFPNPGSPTTNMWGLDLDPFSCSVPPSKPSTRPALTAS